jgi:hypothetical protein
MAAAAVPLALALIPLIPPMVEMVINIVEAIKSDPVVPPEARAKLDQLAADLQVMKARIAAVELPTPGSGA